MKIVYICHPISGDVSGNLKKILRIIRDINLSEPETLPFAHYVVDCYALGDTVPEERERGIKNDIALLSSGCINEVWLYGERISHGMMHEIALAKELNIPVIPKSNEIRGFLELDKPKGIMLAPTDLTPEDIRNFAEKIRNFSGEIIYNPLPGFKSRMNREDVPDEFTPYGYNVKKGIFTVNHAHFKGTFESAEKKYRGYLLGRKNKTKGKGNLDHCKNLITWERWVVSNFMTAKTKKINDNE